MPLKSAYQNLYLVLYENSILAFKESADGGVANVCVSVFERLLSDKYSMERNELTLGIKQCHNWSSTMMALILDNSRRLICH